MKSPRVRIALALLVLGIVAFFVYRSRTADDAEASATSSSIVVVTRGSLVETAAASGTIEPNVQVEVKSRSSGEVIEVLVVEGQSVAAGDLLFRLDPTDAERVVREARAAARRSSAEVAQARATLTIAEVESGDARTSREVSARGTELGVVSAEADRTANRTQTVAEATVDLRRAQVSASSASLATARLSVDEAARRLAETEIRAPIAGTILSVTVERGSIVASAVTNVGGGSALATLADLTDLRVVGQIDEAQIGRVAVGQKAAIRVDAYPDRTFEGRVDRVSPLGTTTSNVVTFDVEMTITDPDANLLRSGMSADVEVETGRFDRVVLVPLTAVRTARGRRFVRLESGEERTIRTGASDGTQIVVLEGLREGDRLRVGGDAPVAASTRSAMPFGRPPRGGGGGGGGHR